MLLRPQDRQNILPPYFPVSEVSPTKSRLHQNRKSESLVHVKNLCLPIFSFLQKHNSSPKSNHKYNKKRKKPTTAANYIYTNVCPPSHRFLRIISFFHCMSINKIYDLRYFCYSESTSRIMYFILPKNRLLRACFLLFTPFTVTPALLFVT